MELLEEEEPKSGFDRRTFLRRAAVTGAVAAWATPVVQTVMARPAFAAGTPFCGHSIGPVSGADSNEGCKGACKASCHTESVLATDAGDPCEIACDALCPNRAGTTDRECCSAGACDVGNWTCAQNGPGGNDDQPCFDGSPAGTCTEEQLAAACLS